MHEPVVEGGRQERRWKEGMAGDQFHWRRLPLGMTHGVLTEIEVHDENFGMKLCGLDLLEVCGVCRSVVSMVLSVGVNVVDSHSVVP